MSWFGKIAGIFNKRKLDKAALAELEDLLVTSDFGLEAAEQIISKISAERFDKEVTDDELKNYLAQEVACILQPYEKQPEISENPHIILVVGVNGNGKTTSVGKLANIYVKQGKKVLVVAADTFRAAAVEQLETWANRAKASFFKGQPNQDPASVAFQAIENAKAENYDIVLLDTAGRLQNKQNLMAELGKITNVCKKLIPAAPHEVVMVLDATTGQNALRQMEEFGKTAGVTSIILTKLDGTAKGGILVALAQKFEVKIAAIGIGEGIDDLKPFSAAEFAKMLIS